MCNFRVGDEVVCVSGEWIGMVGQPVPDRCPVEGETYTVIRVGLFDDHPYIGLDGLGPDDAWDSDHFRKVQRRKTDLSIESFLTIKPGFEEPRRPKAPAKRERV